MAFSGSVSQFPMHTWEYIVRFRQAYSQWVSLNRVMCLLNCNKTYYCNSTITWPYSKKLIGWKHAESEQYIFRYNRILWYNTTGKCHISLPPFLHSRSVMYDLVEQSNNTNRKQIKCCCFDSKRRIHVFLDNTKS